MVDDLQSGVGLAPYTTLRAGGPAEFFSIARSADDLAAFALVLQETNKPMAVLGWGSNVLPSDDGVPGLVVINAARKISIARSGEVVAETGAGFQELFLKAAQAGLGGLEYAVGIPGTIGGALVSNAGAYRSNVSEFLTGVEIVEGGVKRWEDPAWMEFSYRDSRLRRQGGSAATLLRVSMALPPRDPKQIYDEAREYQRQRIRKQPPSASAGSFFKNVQHPELASSLPGLTEGMRKAGIIPAGFLIEQAGLKGYRIGGAMLGTRHANFVLNVARATATDIRRLAAHAQQVVRMSFGIHLEEEVLYLGDWSRFEA